MHEYLCAECFTGTDTHICYQCLKEFREQAAEIERLKAEQCETYKRLAEWHEHWGKQFRSLAAIGKGQVMSLNEAIKKLQETSKPEEKEE